MDLNEFASRNSLVLEGKLSKGWSSEIFLAKTKRGEKVVLKALRAKSNRKEMARRESENLRMANPVGVGPRLVMEDLENNVVVMEYIEGIAFGEWIFSDISKRGLEKFLKELYSQAKKLDEIGLDHGQLAGKGKNILVRKGLPVIIDFEKASSTRKVHNVKVLDSFLFRSKDSALVKRVARVLGKARDSFF